MNNNLPSKNTRSIHPYSIKAMTDKINEAKRLGESVYDNPSDSLPSLRLYTNSGVVMVQSSIPLSNYQPFVQTYEQNDLIDVAEENIPELRDKNTASLYELCCSEIFYNKFQVSDKKTGMSSDAKYFGFADGFYIESSREFVSSILALQEKFDITVAEPILEDYYQDISAMVDDKFWDIIDKCEWKKDFNYDRIGQFLQKNFSPQELILFSLKVREKTSNLYKVADNSDAFSNVRTGGDGFSDCVNHVVGSGRQAYNKCIKEPDFFARFAKSGGFKESFSYAVPTVMQLSFYPYPVRKGYSGGPSEFETKAYASFYLQKILDIDFDEIVPRAHAETRLKQDQAIFRLQNVIDGNYRAAYQDFNEKTYSELGRIEGADVGYGVANVISDIMKIDGFNFKTVEWVNGEPRNPVKDRQLDSRHQNELGC